MRKIIFWIFLMMLGSLPAQAHEKRPVAEKYTFIVGFVNEPVFAGEMNGVDLRVLENEAPVEGLENALNVNVRYGNQKKSLALPFLARHKQPGAYAAYFLPSKAGKYTFEITGSIGGKEIKEVFTRKDIRDAQELKWPK